MNSTTPEKPPENPWLDAMRALSHITTAITLMLVCGGLGYGLDGLLGITFFTLIGFIGGGYWAVKHLIKVLG